ncbi:MAG: efflux RND transporter periplasmic adaptor subunit [Acidobacteriota bacterium]|nr:MAG: efflux RND transporter periplasmic adaptor subunit [Acidobacteriota bacterium]
MKKHRLYPIIFLLLLPLGCGGEAERREEAAAPITVRTRGIDVSKAAATFEAIGTIEAKDSAALGTKIMGRVTRIHASEGQSVKKGQVLVEIDAGDVAAKRAQAEAVLKERESQYQRIQRLFSEGAATRRELDMAEAAYESAKASKEEVDNILRYKDVHAPFDGVVTKKLTDEGVVVGPGQHLLTVENLDEVTARVSVPENRISGIEKDDRTDVSVEAVERIFETAVSEIVPSANGGGRMYDVKIEIPNEDGVLKPGMTARARFDLPEGSAHSLIIPQEAVVSYEALDGVFVVQDGRARFQLVRVGKSEGGEVEILSGLEQGDVIVTGGMEGLKDGQPVVAEE